MFVAELEPEALLECIPLEEYARKLDKHKRTLWDYHRKGRWNHARTKLVFLRLAWLPSSCWGCSDTLYADFLRELNSIT